MAGSFFSGMIYEVRIYHRALKTEDRKPGMDESVSGKKQFRKRRTERR